MKFHKDDLVSIETDRIGLHNIKQRGQALKTNGVVIHCVDLAGYRIWVLRADNGEENFFFPNELTKIETETERNNEAGIEAALTTFQEPCRTVWDCKSHASNTARKLFDQFRAF